MVYQDKTIVCVDCGESFVFSADDQQFHASRGYQDPKRCPNCRQARRQAMGGGPARPMYDAVCARCGAKTQVPFLPRQDRPVYCSDCFNKVRPAPRRGF
ncbi:MAG: zinc-ribbon domain containing protein [Dehalococcoidia bacterium]|nr:zinc-ribbon domain containing protein [Dehalococcoidia bacterium]MDW8009696.1 CxxC-x17-CxxC domain-containing protein [Chloroflexota bacterium]